ncbi:MAG: type I restriction-modification system endonuclease [Candidatus Sericytochromatia bacterium]
MSAFAFLQPVAPDLCRLGQQAERYAADDPDAALTKLRLLGEKLVSELLEQHALQIEPKQFVRLQALQNAGLLPAPVLDILHAIRKVGNRAVHEGQASQRETQALISMSVKLCQWYAAVRHGVEPGPRPAPALVRPVSALPAATVPAAGEEPQQPAPVAVGEALNALLSLNEAETRLLIDSQLRAAGWEVDSERLSFARGTRPEKNRCLAIAEWPVGRRRADYALFDGLRLVGLIEAKRQGKDVVSDLQQAKVYARELTPAHGAELCGPWGDYQAPFLFASNGRPFLKNLAEKSGIWFLDARLNSNHPRALQHWHSPESLRDLLQRDEASAYIRLQREPLDYLQDPAGLGLRPYQLKAIAAVEQTLAQGRREALVAMATGTGKTRTVIGLIYRLLKSDRFKRILFLVDRNVLGEQSSDAFKDATVEDLLRFTQTYDVGELKDRRPDLATKVQIATVQSMVQRLFYSADESSVLPVDTYDCIVVDEAHRGYVLDRELSEDSLAFKNEADYLGQYRRVLDWFDSVKIALTATPAAHTVAIFGPLVYQYSYREAVVDGYLIDHTPPYLIETQLQQQGIQWRIGETVATYEVNTGQISSEVLEDEVNIDVTGFNTRVITENFNRVVAQELVKHLDPAGDEKTLIFAANDAHADLVVRLLKEAFSELGEPVDDDAIVKITGSVYQPQQQVRRFKNERLPNIVVTVDLLTTGVDVPEICNLVFLRRVKSRILYEQMLGRATRRCDRIGKDYFQIFDAVGLYALLQDFTDMKPVASNPRQPFVGLLDELERIPEAFPEARLQRAQQTRQVETIVARLQGKLRFLSPEAQQLFAAKSGGLTPKAFVEAIQDRPAAEAAAFLAAQRPALSLLDTIKGKGRRQLISNHDDTVVNVSRGYGRGEKPEDYLAGFEAFVRDNRNRLMALQLVCTRPQELTRQSLRELRFELDQAGYSEAQLRAAWKDLTHEDLAADIIAFVRRYSLGDALIPPEQRIQRAMQRVRGLRDWNKIQLRWLERIEKQLLKETVLEAADFDAPPFQQDGGFKRLNQIFNQELHAVLGWIQEGLYG